MRHLLKLAFCAGIFAWLAPSGYSQASYRFEVFGGAGVIQSSGLFRDSGLAANVGGGVGLRPFASTRPRLHRLGVEFTVDTQREDPEVTIFGSAPTFPAERRQVQYLGNVLYHFTGGRFQPYALAGVGGVRKPSSEFAGAVGAGLKIFAAPHIYVRPEFRLSLARTLDSAARGSVAVGLVW